MEESGKGMVAVIGAGAAGLAAADLLSRNGRRVVILEARDRVGGRMLTRQGHAGSGVVELGAEFIHGRPEATLALLREAGIAVAPFHGDHWQLRDGHLAEMDDTTLELHQLMALARAQVGDRSVESFLDEVSRKPELVAAADWMRNLVQGFDAADPARASLKAIVAEWSGHASVESHQGHPVGGYGPLAEFMLQRLDQALVDVRLGAPVRQVQWSPGGVVLQVDGVGSLDASAVVVTVPLSILQLDAGAASAIRFDPPLAAKATAFAGLAMGGVHRVMLRYAEPPWEQHFGGPVAAGTFFHAPGQLFPTFWTGATGSPWLTGWCAGPRVAQVGIANDAFIIAKAIESARALFADLPAAALQPVETRFHNWERDPWALGAYSYVAVGGAEARTTLAEPLGGVLFFAGEATDQAGEAGTVAGAIMSGQRAAREILK